MLSLFDDILTIWILHGECANTIPDINSIIHRMLFNALYVQMYQCIVDVIDFACEECEIHSVYHSNHICAADVVHVQRSVSISLELFYILLERTTGIQWESPYITIYWEHNGIMHALLVNTYIDHEEFSIVIT